MSEKPNIKLGDWISIRGEFYSKNAIVCFVYKDNSFADIEVVYLDDGDRAINEDMIWKDGEWEFKISGPCGGYADGTPRLSSYVSQLRSGKKYFV